MVQNVNNYTTMKRHRNTSELSRLSHFTVGRDRWDKDLPGSIPGPNKPNY